MEKQDITAKKLAKIEETAERIKVPHKRLMLTKLDLELAFSITKLDGGNEKANQKIRQNFIVNLISILEFYIKGVIMDCEEFWNEEGIKSLLNQQTTLAAAFEMFKNERVTPAIVIAHSSTISNLENIFNVIDKLSKSSIHYQAAMSKYFNELVKQGQTKFEDWQGILGRIFTLRHRIIHSKIYDNLPDDVIADYNSIVNCFIDASEEHMGNVIQELKKKKEASGT